MEKANNLRSNSPLTQKKAQEDFRDKIRRQAPEKKKRNRRTADEI